VVRERRLVFLVRERERDPQLQAVQPRTALTHFRRRPLRVHDAATRRHPVDVAGSDRSQRADAVAVHDLALEQVRDRREPDVRMRRHGETRSG